MLLAAHLFPPPAIALPALRLFEAVPKGQRTAVVASPVVIRALRGRSGRLRRRRRQWCWEDSNLISRVACQKAPVCANSANQEELSDEESDERPVSSLAGVL